MNVIKDRIVRGNLDNYDDIIYIENSLLPNEIYKQIERKNLNKKEYIVVVIYSYIIKKLDNIFLSSLVPVIGFFLSTLSLNIIRKI